MSQQTDVPASSSSEGGPARDSGRHDSRSQHFLRSITGVRDDAPASERYLGVVLLGILVVVFWLASPQFLTAVNFEGIGGENSVQALLSLGLIFPLAAGVFDVSVADTFTLAVVEVTALFQTTHGHIPIALAIIITLAGAFVIGLCNGALVVRFKLDPFIATIGTGALLDAVSEIIGNGKTIDLNIPSGFVHIGVATWRGVPISIFFVVVAACIAWYILEQTPAGRSLYATGAGRDIASLVGVKTDRAIYWAYIASALGACAAGILFAAQQAAGPPESGTAYLLPAYSTVFLGMTILRPGRFNVWGLLVGVLILAIGINGFELLGGAFWIQNLFEGAVLIGAVTLSTWRSRRKASR